MSHLFFCITSDCGNTAVAGTTCAECTTWSKACPGCGDTGATVLGSDYCHTCMSARNHPCVTQPADGWCPECDMYTVVLPNICSRCQQKRDDVCTCSSGGEPCDHCARYLADEAEYDVWCGVDELGEPQCDGGPSCELCAEPRCECDGGPMCDLCAEEYKEPCRGCGMPSQLWTDDTYCRKCYVDRYGDEFPKPKPDVRTAREKIIADIVEIEARLKTKMTEDQKDDWIWLLQNRRGDLAAAEKEIWGRSLEAMRVDVRAIEWRLKTATTEDEKDEWIWLLQVRRGDLAAAEKELWEQYDKDDLRKLDQANRHGF